MEKEQFYMQLSHYLLTKFCDGFIEISKEDWSKDEYLTIKHRFNNETNKIEVVALKDSIN